MNTIPFYLDCDSLGRSWEELNLLGVGTEHKAVLEL